MGGREDRDGLQLIVVDRELVLFGQTQQVLSMLALEPDLGVCKHLSLCLLTLYIQSKAIVSLLLKACGFTFEQPPIDSIQGQQSMLKCMFFSFEADLPQDCNGVLPNRSLLSLDRAPLLLDSQLGFELIMQQVHLARKLCDSL